MFDIFILQKTYNANKTFLNIFVVFIAFIYAEVVNFWGRLEAKDCQLYNEEVAQLRNKTLKTF